jgi:hypothetical protein
MLPPTRPSAPSTSDWPWFRSQLDVDAALVARILSTAAAPNAGIGERSHLVDGGWRSGERLLHWPESQATIAALRDQLAAKEIRAWAVVHRGDSSYHNWHRHEGTVWRCSGVLYLTTGGASTLFRLDGRIVRSVPIAGEVITFPPTIEHATERHYGSPRVTLAFNVL